MKIEKEEKRNENEELMLERRDTGQEMERSGRREVNTNGGSDVSTEGMAYQSGTQSEGAITLSEEDSDPETDNRDENQEDIERHQEDNKEKFHEVGKGWRDEEEGNSERGNDSRGSDSDETYNSTHELDDAEIISSLSEREAQDEDTEKEDGGEYRGRRVRKGDGDKLREIQDLRRGAAIKREQGNRGEGRIGNTARL